MKAITYFAGQFVLLGAICSGLTVMVVGLCVSVGWLSQFIL